MLPPMILARIGALCYIAWGIFHVNAAYEIYKLGAAQSGITQGRLFQLAAYMLCIAMFAIATSAAGNWRNELRSYWLNLIVIGWADLVWVLMVVLPGYVPLLRGLLPPAIFVLGTLLTTAARRLAPCPSTRGIELMKSTKRVKLGILIVMSMHIATGYAQPSAPRGLAVVELYTSQGCSSCPPADAVLGELAQLPNVIALAFHVAYWDDIGWSDHFALPIATQRQRRYEETLGLSSAFTPQAIVDGRGSFVGSDKRRIVSALFEQQIAIPIDLQVAHGQLTVALPDRPGYGGYEVNMAAYLSQAQTQVGRGENTGRTLTEFNIVRQFRTLGLWQGREAIFRVPLDGIPADATSVAVILQRAEQGPIAGSASIALR